ncbi:MAG: beta-ketoacyl-ACP synthase II [Spirochaetes bacterium]|nr:beta-ketoacyl-ACP synthase II [Spirochaetota bacterium]
MTPSNRINPSVRVVITGIGTINPLGRSVPEYWANLAIGKNGVRRVQRTPLPENFPVKVGGEVDLPEDMTPYLPKKMMRRLDRFVHLGMVAATEAFHDSHLDAEAIAKAPHRYGAIIGTGDAGVGFTYETFKTIETKGMDHTSPFYVVGVIPNTLSGFFAKERGLQGPNFSINSACATSNHSLGTAASFIRTGLADVIFAGGSEAVVNTAGFAGFNAIFALSRRSVDPETASRPFDKDRDGFVLGEGAGVLCLEELGHAKARGARIYGELTGFGMSCDAHDLVAPHPEGRGSALAMRFALEDARLAPEAIGLINAHGTSTPIGDLAECIGIHQAFGAAAASIPVHSTKSMTGHLIGAAGGIEAIACLQALNESLVHPTIHLHEKDPRIDLDIVSPGAREISVDHVLSNSFGFGGHNACIVLSKFKD